MNWRVASISDFNFNFKLVVGLSNTEKYYHVWAKAY
jgi:hypothetical protein